MSDKHLRVRLRKQFETEDGEDWEAIWPEQHELLLSAVKSFTTVFDAHIADVIERVVRFVSKSPLNSRLSNMSDTPNDMVTKVSGMSRTPIPFW